MPLCNDSRGGLWKSQKEVNKTFRSDFTSWQRGRAHPPAVKELQEMLADTGVVAHRLTVSLKHKQVLYVEKTTLPATSSQKCLTDAKQHLDTAMSFWKKVLCRREIKLKLCARITKSVFGEIMSI